MKTAQKAHGWVKVAYQKVQMFRFEVLVYAKVALVASHVASLSAGIKMELYAYKGSRSYNFVDHCDHFMVVRDRGLC